MLRNLRIAFSATCLIACVLLIALWVRSYFYIDGLTIRGGRQITTFDGRLFVSEKFALKKSSTSRQYMPTIRDSFHHNVRYFSFALGEALRRGRGFAIPYWCILFPAAAAITLPWLRWRFSLRTLLIATTLVAIVLGLIVW
jgi:hypothetical protein